MTVGSGLADWCGNEWSGVGFMAEPGYHCVKRVGWKKEDKAPIRCCFGQFKQSLYLNNHLTMHQNFDFGLIVIS